MREIQKLRNREKDRKRERERGEGLEEREIN